MNAWLRKQLANLGLAVNGPSPEIVAFVEETERATQHILEVAERLDRCARHPLPIRRVK